MITRVTSLPRDTSGDEHSIVLSAPSKACIDPHCPFFAPFLMSDSQALVRDGFRCMITGMFDSGSLENNEALRDMGNRDGANGVMIRPCHFLSEAKTQGADPDGDRWRRHDGKAQLVSVEPFVLLTNHSDALRCWCHGPAGGFRILTSH